MRGRAGRLPGPRGLPSFVPCRPGAPLFRDGPMPRSPLPALALALLAAPAAASCEGPTLLDALAPAERAALDAAADAVPYGEGLLWEARRDGATVILAGTMHLADPRHAPLERALAPALGGADLLLLETTAEGEARALAAMAERPDLTLVIDGPTLPERLSPEDWEAVAEAARDRGLPPFTVAKLRPWIALTTLSAPPCLLEAAQGGTAGGLDGLLRARAGDLGLPVEALEPWDTVFRLADALDASSDAQSLMAAIADPALAESATVATLDAYFAGRTGEMMELSRLANGLMGLPEDASVASDTALLDDRNAAWVPVIEAASARAPRLVVAAGAAHLPGEGGVLARLAARGWAVTPLDPAACCEGVWGG